MMEQSIYYVFHSFSCIIIILFSSNPVFTFNEVDELDGFFQNTVKDKFLKHDYHSNDLPFSMTMDLGTIKFSTIFSNLVRLKIGVCKERKIYVAKCGLAFIHTFNF